MTAGASVERTRLAWRRTMLGVSVACTIMIVTAAYRGLDARRGAILAAAMLVWLGCLLVSHRRIQALHASTAGDPPEIARTVTLTGLAVATLALLGLALL
jgi:hypothetical protein